MSVFRKMLIDSQRLVYREQCLGVTDIGFEEYLFLRWDMDHAFATKAGNRSTVHGDGIHPVYAFWTQQFVGVVDNVQASVDHEDWLSGGTEGSGIDYLSINARILSTHVEENLTPWSLVTVLIDFTQLLRLRAVPPASSERLRFTGSTLWRPTTSKLGIGVEGPVDRYAT
ncbi:uncharacterized protein CLAFUR5_08765 [Fulvia fulva]|uniref:Uncharacterized protein n=1 Tax=Passalora fulva TaxID=5499 RepID=A0A9Q8LDV7_PASFU|nr:uncharacterized protein CLAFUR5_08765 [Fulvia fulva]KAK4630163.1 hypothetical protein CLAFUR0_08664 [Fulvia fulva]UJO15603.1 hypothetical protein CLAFUR5_08765 [Fulvia fulva]